MAEATFDHNAGNVMAVENHSVLTVHSLLESFISEPLSETDHDVFQCGKCKKQFTSITEFFSHKRECSNIITVNPTLNPPAPSQLSSNSQNTVIVQKIQVPPPSISGYTQNVVFADTDMFSLTGSDVESAVPSNSTIQISHEETIEPQNHSVTLQQVIPQVPMLSPLPTVGQPTNTVEVPFINNKLISGPLFLMSQSPGNTGISGYVLNISNSVEANNCELNLAEEEKLNKSDSVENNVSDSASADTNSNTVNVIAEFHSSMVKTKKKTADNELGDGSKKDQKLNCAYCRKTFSKNFDLQQHIRSHTGEKPFQCIVCGRAFAQKSNVKKHMHAHKVWPDGLSHTLPHLQNKDGHTNEKENKELFCVEHENEDSENSYACPYCSYTCKNYYNLKSHMKQHETKKVYKCIVSTCGQMFPDLGPFLDHMKTHEKEMTYQCHECHKNFSSLYDLGFHQYTHNLFPKKKTNSPKRFYKCSLCVNKYKTLAALNHHIATSPHTYLCQYCNKVFSCERYLRRHLRIHTDPDSFLCKYCDKGFKTEHYLKVHMLIHSNSKPFECNICKSAFNRKDRLKRHMLIHEPVKRFKCLLRSYGCTKAFNRADKLKAHILTHSCFKPYVCKACGKSFIQFAQLRNHVKFHNGNSTENCHFCAEKLIDSEEHQCNVLKQRKMLSRKLKIARLRKMRKGIFNNTRRKCKRQSKTPHTSVIEQNDEIPTAHIEIISADGEFIASGTVSHIDLQETNNGDHSQFNVVDVTQEVSPVLATLQIDTSDLSDKPNNE